MKTSKNKNILVVGLIFTVIMTSIPVSVNATSNCVTDRCKQAEAAEAEALEKAANATSAANTLAAEVQRLNNQIAIYEARIRANEALLDDLHMQIEENTAKLKLQQQALAGMLADLHFEGRQNDAIMVLASSSSLSDYAEKQSRADTAKNQVTLSAQTVKALKEDLESQKAEVEHILADQELQKATVEETRSKQQALVAQYRDNAAAYTADAEAAAKIKKEEIAAYIRANQQDKYAQYANDSTGYLAAVRARGMDCPRSNWQYNGGYVYSFDYYVVCECVSYVDYKVQRTWGIKTAWGNAADWGWHAKAAGYRVDHEPAVDTVGYTSNGRFGHVVWVENVSTDSSGNKIITYSQYNGTYDYQNNSADARYSEGWSNASAFDGFIHFDR
ncbi:MAG: hypothetical protein Q4E47_02695 [Candidatus Saccharibacteria bacterium]|nr:hypothetical protein [Candidatus Saccharibacteria bacterium]